MGNFCSTREAQITIEQWKKHVNKKRPHSALDFRPLALEIASTRDQRPIQ